jgi:hypothetical protein
MKGKAFAGLVLAFLFWILCAASCAPQHTASSHHALADDDDNDDASPDDDDNDNDDASPDDDDDNDDDNDDNDNDDNDDDSACDSATCPTGCCNGMTCEPGNTSAQCGTGGAACVDCQGYGCENGVCGVATWTDPDSGHTWQVTPTNNLMDQADAETYCSNLTLGGYSDWTLPDISALRSAIKGCVNTDTGGACDVSDSCLDTVCSNSACTGCPGSSGPGAGGCFWPPQFEGDCFGLSEFYDSSSLVADDSGYEWTINFGPAWIFDGGPATSTGFVRCMR